MCDRDLLRASASGPPVDPFTKRSPTAFVSDPTPGRLRPSDITCMGRDSGPNQPR